MAPGIARMSAHAERHPPRSFPGPHRIGAFWGSWRSYHFGVITLLAIHYLRPFGSVGGLKSIGTLSFPVEMGGVIFVPLYCLFAQAGAFAGPQTARGTQFKAPGPAAREAILRNRQAHFSV